jgi:hypothetical protein
MISLKIQSDQDILILGKKGSGKTTLAKFLVRNLPFRFLIFDVIGNWAEFRKEYNYILVSPRNHIQYINQILMKVWNAGNYYIIYDEFDQYPYSGMVSTIINIGRNRNIAGMYIARRTVNIHKDILQNATWTFVFGNNAYRDIEHINENYNIDSRAWTRYQNLKPYEFLIFYDRDYYAKGKIVNQRLKLYL